MIVCVCRDEIERCANSRCRITLQHKTQRRGRCPSTSPSLSLRSTSSSICGRARLCVVQDHARHADVGAGRAPKVPSSHRRLFSLLYVYDALRARNVIQLVLHTFFNLCILVYASIQITQTRTALAGLGQVVRCGRYIRCTGPDSLFNTILGLFIVTPIVIGVCSIGFALLIKKLYAEFGWAEFRLVGASLEMKRTSSDPAADQGVTVGCCPMRICRRGWAVAATSQGLADRSRPSSS